MGTGASRIGVDAAGGIITGPGCTSVKVNGSVISVHGDLVASHGTAPHNAPTMVASNNNVYAGGILVVRAGNLATCGHAASGSVDVLIG